MPYGIFYRVGRFFRGQPYFRRNGRMRCEQPQPCSWSHRLGIRFLSQLSRGPFSNFVPQSHHTMCFGGHLWYKSIRGCSFLSTGFGKHLKRRRGSPSIWGMVAPTSPVWYSGEDKGGTPSTPDSRKTLGDSPSLSEPLDGDSPSSEEKNTVRACESRGWLVETARQQHAVKPDLSAYPQLDTADGHTDTQLSASEPFP